MSAAAGPSRGSGSVASGSTPTSPKKKNKRQRETSAPGYTGPLVPTNNGKGGPVKMPLVIRSGYAIPGAATKVAKQRAKHVVSRMSTSQTGLEPVYDQEILREFGVEIDVSTMSAKQIRRKRDRMYRERQAQADLPAGGKSNKLVIRELKRQQKMAAAKAGQASSGKGPTPSASGSREGSSRSTLESSPQGPNEGEDAKEEESARPPRRKRGKKAKSDVIDLDGESIVESVPKDSQAEPDPMFVEDDAGMPAQAADRLATLPAGLLSNFMSGTDIQQASSEVDLSELDGIPVEETGEAPMPFEHSLPSTPAVAQQEAEAASSLFTIDAEPAPVKGSKTTEQTGDLLPDEILLEAKGPVEEIALDEGDMKGIINDDNTRATAVKRYYDDEDGPARPRNDTVKCGRCGEQGHIAKDCEHQQCMTCGAMDDHEFRDCPLLKVCWRCGNKGHTNGVSSNPASLVRRLT
ncbi:uncharacterized protein L969DRAFT_445390 [Mixia osmundae IAM 14324]|uniref:uncharacterized protein n=1 Tax=Mixia osmundae (strain CBS 9802 / IAM 14324 / JCM 22182 / KY 12970) TaxID=764103 RepID=UPI0004A54F3E|nr:uncharacterized protein L969DRAFT_445390 [Mixia osmundae IAM 14324]KEI39405.1 hypothetical protein L969DRAFT_445390 [Mixia osmundae IAM 14324]